MNYDVSEDIHNQTHAYLTCRVLKGIHRSYGSGYGKFFKPEPTYLKALYTQHSIQPMIRRLLNPPEMLACNILCERRMPGNREGLLPHLDIPWVVAQPLLDDLCQQLIQYLDRYVLDTPSMGNI